MEAKWRGPQSRVRGVWWEVWTYSDRIVLLAAYLGVEALAMVRSKVCGLGFEGNGRWKWKWKLEKGKKVKVQERNKKSNDRRKKNRWAVPPRQSFLFAGSFLRFDSHSFYHLCSLPCLCVHGFSWIFILGHCTTLNHTAYCASMDGGEVQKPNRESTNAKIAPHQSRAAHVTRVGVFGVSAFSSILSAFHSNSLFLPSFSDINHYSHTTPSLQKK